MKNLKKLILISLSTLTWSLGSTGGGLSTEDSKESLEQRLQTLKQENKQAEVANLKAQIAEEEKKKEDREGTSATSESQSQPSPGQSSAPQEEDKKSTWVRERNRVEDQVQDKWNKVKNIF